MAQPTKATTREANPIEMSQRRRNPDAGGGLLTSVRLAFVFRSSASDRSGKVSRCARLAWPGHQVGHDDVDRQGRVPQIGGASTRAHPDVVVGAVQREVEVRADTVSTWAVVAVDRGG